VVVEETAQRTPEQAIVLASPEVRKLFAATEWHAIDKDQTVSNDLEPYLQRAKTLTLPVLFLVGTNGTVYYEGALPGDVAAMIALVKKYLPTKGGQP
jgi:hypothetical protein